MMDESQTEAKSDCPQDPQVEPGPQPMEIEQQQPMVQHEHGRKRGKQFWILMAIFNAAVIIGFVVMVRRSGNEDESPDAGLSGNNERENEPSRIIGGYPSYQNKFPYYVDTGNCGGALIAPRVVLSAAHCGASSSWYGTNTVIVNAPRRGDVGTFGKVRSWSRWIAHPGYSDTGTAPINDFALYLLDEPVTGLPVSLSLNNEPSFPPDGTPVVAIGTGEQNNGSSRITKGPLFLHDVAFPVINAEECKEFWGPFLNPDIMLCAGQIGKGICYGDSGGPLVVRDGNRDILVGIVSFLGNRNCAKSHKYENIFARTSGVFPWIKSVVCDQWGEQADFCSGNHLCFDKPGWADPDGFGCQAYADTEATDVRICEYHQNKTGTGGLSPVQACCVCSYVNPPTNLPVGPCFDYSAWVDHNGYNCAAYAGVEAQGVPICEYHKNIPGAGGLSPVQACCVCNYVTGQGSNPNPPTTPTTPGSCSDSPGWTDPNGYDCAAYAATEAQDVPICEYHRDIPGAGGLSPVQACCVCNYITAEQVNNPNTSANPAPPPASCSDSPGWTDPNGYDCSAYAGTEAQGTPICQYHRDIPGAGGLTPVQACCICK